MEAMEPPKYEEVVTEQPVLSEAVEGEAEAESEEDAFDSLVGVDMPVDAGKLEETSFGVSMPGVADRSATVLSESALKSTEK